MVTLREQPGQVRQEPHLWDGQRHRRIPSIGIYGPSGSGRTRLALETILGFDVDGPVVIIDINHNVDAALDELEVPAGRVKTIDWPDARKHPQRLLDWMQRGRHAALLIDGFDGFWQGGLQWKDALVAAKHPTPWDIVGATWDALVEQIKFPDAPLVITGGAKTIEGDGPLLAETVRPTWRDDVGSAFDITLRTERSVDGEFLVMVDRTRGVPSGPANLTLERYARWADGGSKPPRVAANPYRDAAMAELRERLHAFDDDEERQAAIIDEAVQHELCQPGTRKLRSRLAWGELEQLENIIERYEDDIITGWLDEAASGRWEAAVQQLADGTVDADAWAVLYDALGDDEKQVLADRAATCGIKDVRSPKPGEIAIITGWLDEITDKGTK